MLPSQLFSGWLAPALCLSPAGAVRPSSDVEEAALDAASELGGPNGRNKLGDQLEEASDFLRKLDIAWLIFMSFLAWAVLYWRPVALVGSDPGRGERKYKLAPWYRTLFASLTSHAAGVIGFVGFQKTVVARIVANSRPQKTWSLAQFLLYTSLAISILAIFTSLVFLGVDYMRRLAMDSAASRGFRLVLQPVKIERTGLGVVLLILAVILLSLYLSVIAVEYMKAGSTVDLLLLVNLVCGCFTVLLYFVNLRSLCESPKVQAHTTTGQEELRKLEDFLDECNGGEANQSDGFRQRLADFLGYTAGKDLALFVTSGSRRAFFQSQRRAPVLHVVCVLLFIGTLPIICQLTAERLFVTPQIVDMKPLSAALVPRFQLGSDRDLYRLLVNAETASLQVLPQYEQASSISLCCNSIPCDEQHFEHSLVKYESKPKVLEIPRNVTKCTLTILGHSSRAKKDIFIDVEPSSMFKLSDCAESGCKCRQGYFGTYESNNLNVSGSCAPASCNVANSTGQAGDECACLDGFVSTVHWNGAGWDGSCTPAECGIANSVGNGLHCRCRDKFRGEISWKKSTASGKCEPAQCEGVDYSNGMPGEECGCADEYAGTVSWSGTAFRGNCTPAPCNIENSSKEPGPHCRCLDGYQGEIKWQGAKPIGQCLPVPCDVAHSNRTNGSKCQCANGFNGTILWKGGSFQGSCLEAPCKVANSTGGSGWNCRCRDAFVGNITWEGPDTRGQCVPAPCNVENSNRAPGLACQCEDGFVGRVKWDRTQPVAKSICKPAKCDVKNSEGRGHNCTCEDGFIGNISWKGRFCSGWCEEAPCEIPSTDGSGPDCRCIRGYTGHITWKGSRAFGTCRPKPCAVRNSNMKSGPECRCLEGFNDLLDYESSETEITGRCPEMDCLGEHSNHKPGPNCRCVDGFDGSRTIIQTEVHRTVKIFDVNKSPSTVPDNAFAYKVQCKPAPCLVENSNQFPGWECQCKDGFSGKISWTGAKPEGECVPTMCNIENSNRQPGPACRCRVGFRGKIRWRGTEPWGECKVVPCHVVNSDYAAGPECRCAEGFAGLINHGSDEFWQTVGVCNPLPVCSTEIVHEAILSADLQDSQNITCRQGQQVLARGMKCNAMGAIQWISAEATKPGRCQWSGGEIQAGCGGPVPHQLNLPSQCIEQPALPACAATIPFPVTSRQASRYICGSSTPLLDDQVVHFRGRRCGYDLIQWEAAVVSPLAYSCTYNLSTGCGEALPGEPQLPRMCLQRSEPAVFKIPATNQTVKLFDDGSFSLEPSQDGKKTWHSDGRYLSLRRKTATGQVDWGFEIRPGNPKWFTCRNSSGLDARGDLPLWWTFRFQEEAHAQYNADRLSGCEQSFFLGGSCYWIRFGQEIQKTSGDALCASSSFKGQNETTYTYLTSAYGIQTYRSKVSCLPTAAYLELRLEVVDIDRNHSSKEILHAPCRTTIRIAMDAVSMEAGCNNVYEGIYKNDANCPVLASSTDGMDMEDVDGMDMEDVDGMDMEDVDTMDTEDVDDMGMEDVDTMDTEDVDDMGMVD